MPRDRQTNFENEVEEFEGQRRSRQLGQKRRVVEPYGFRHILNLGKWVSKSSEKKYRYNPTTTESKIIWCKGQEVLKYLVEIQSDKIKKEYWSHRK